MTSRYITASFEGFFDMPELFSSVTEYDGRRGSGAVDRVSSPFVSIGRWIGLSGKGLSSPSCLEGVINQRR